MTDQRSAMTIAEMTAFLDREFPQVNYGAAPGERLFVVEEVGAGRCRIRMRHHEKNIRPGGTLSGPSMFTLADLAFYVAVLGALGPVALAVTTNLNINFLRKPAQRDMLCECRMLKIGKRLAVGEATLFSEGEEDPVAHVTGTYSIPPR
ncbi:MAG: PaaI family thioesterase [Beijerinckiaceae bacterium]